MKNRWEKASRLHRSSISLQINRFPNRCSNLFQWNILSRVWLPRLRNHPRLQPRKLQRSSSTFNPLNTYWEYSTTHTSRIRQLFLRISQQFIPRFNSARKSSACFTFFIHETNASPNLYRLQNSSLIIMLFLSSANSSVSGTLRAKSNN